MDSDEKGLIRQGHERVLTARFRDAEFFWNADQKLPLRDRLPLLDKVTYQAKLGSYGDKIRRMKSIAGKYLRSHLRHKGSDDAPARLRAGDAGGGSLQVRPDHADGAGIHGTARHRGRALRQGAGGTGGSCRPPSTTITSRWEQKGASPRTLVGALVSLADKVDSVVAGFAVGYEPTGSSDPFALRRQANGAN